MDILYTLAAIPGKYSHPPVQTRIAKETLVAIIEEDLLSNGYIESYSITDDRQFPYPDKMPDISELSVFLGKIVIRVL